MELKKLTPEQAFAALREGKKVYAIREVDLSITMADLLIESLAVESEEPVALENLSQGGAEETGLGKNRSAA